jgi:hypothetical protein
MGKTAVGARSGCRRNPRRRAAGSGSAGGRGTASAERQPSPRVGNFLGARRRASWAPGRETAAVFFFP